ncbi:MAG: polysaccharide biosynthesis protein, partial [Candidatus Omnitrophica bacterium]|nr:polysaccharide biosynthesis protein [Candidatus Omnitrophota bacterium]
SWQRIRSYFDEFYTYSAPLVAYALAGFVFGVLDIWLLEKFAGSVQQGFYGLAFKIGAICFLFTSSMTPLLMREFSISFERGDAEKMRYQFCRYIPLFYTVTAITSVFLSVQADNISYLFGGKEFAGANLTIALMTFYPIHQTYGQLSNSLLFATGQTKLHRNIGFIQMTVTAVMTYFLIAPKDLFGMNLGAFGLAIKMIIAQMFGVYVRLWFNTKYLKVSFLKFVVHNIISVSAVGSIAYVSSTIIRTLVPGSAFITFLLSGIVYLILVGGVIYFWPGILAMNRAELLEKINLVKTKLKKS